MRDFIGFGSDGGDMERSEGSEDENTNSDTSEEIVVSILR